MKNQEIAELFERIADALEIKGETGFKVVAYRKASRVLQDMTEDVAKVAEEGRLETIPGIGERAAKKIERVRPDRPDGEVRRGHVRRPGDAPRPPRDPGPRRQDRPPDARRARDRGPRRAQAEPSPTARWPGSPGWARRRSRTSARASRRASRSPSASPSASAAAGRRGRRLPVRRALRRPGLRGRVPAEDEGDGRRHRRPGLGQGRRGDRPPLRRHPGTVRVLAEGDTKGSIVVRAGETERQVDLRVVDAAEFGAALLYFTGSKAHNIKLRGLAKDRGLKISEYGVFRGAKRLASRDEEDCYRVLGMPWIPPEMREDRGEIELALEGRLPRLVEAADIKGDLHVHTRASDGHLSLGEVAALAREMGYAYIAICDHSQVGQVRPRPGRRPAGRGDGGDRGLQPDAVGLPRPEGQRGRHPVRRRARFPRRAPGPPRFRRRRRPLGFQEGRHRGACSRPSRTLTSGRSPIRRAG